jgi:paraquat-inducible protein B
MGSKQKQTKERQQQEFTQQLAARKTLLLEKGLKQKTIVNDKVIKHLQAELKRTRRAIATIDTTLELREKAKYRKLERERKKASEGLESKEQKEISADPEKAKKNRKQ